jgi:hypothetical protein
MKRMLVWACAVTLLFAGWLAQISWMEARAVDSWHHQLLPLATGDPFYEKFIKEYFSSYSELSRPVCVNETFCTGRVNILVIDIPQGEKAQVEAYRRNMVAIGRELLVIDKTLFDLLLITSNYAFKAKMANAIFLKSNFGPFATLTLWGQQYVNVYRNVRDHGAWVENEAGRIKAGMSGMEALTAESVGGVPVGEISRLVQLAAFGFLIEHEIGHLEMGRLQRATLRLSSFLKYGYRNLSRQEEDFVDRRALARMENVISRLTALHPIIEDGGIEFSGLYANFLFFWVEGMFPLLDGFRGLIAEDHLFEISFEECELNTRLLRLIPDQVFAMTGSLRQGRLKPLPVLGLADYEKWRSALVSSGTHSHAAIRAEHILANVALRLEKSTGRAVDPQRIGLCPGMVERAALTSFSSQACGTSPESTLRLNRVIKTLSQNGAVFEKGFFCPTETCLVATDGGTVVEIVSRGEVVIEIRVTHKRETEPSAFFNVALEVLSDAASVKREVLQLVVESVAASCPGAYKVLAGGDSGALIYANRLATPSHISLRYIVAR